MGDGHTGSDGDGGLPEQGVPCFRCGICCVRYQVLVDEAEAREIARRLGLTRNDWLERYVNPAWPGHDTFILRQREGACIFMAQDGNVTRCGIQAFKPASCREWSAGLDRAECRDGLSRHWGLTVGQSGRIEGPDECLESFRTFLTTLTVAGDGSPSPSAWLHRRP